MGQMLAIIASFLDLRWSRKIFYHKWCVYVVSARHCLALIHHTTSGTRNDIAILLWLCTPASSVVKASMCRPRIQETWDPFLALNLVWVIFGKSFHFSLPLFALQPFVNLDQEWAKYGLRAGSSLRLSLQCFTWGHALPTHAGAACAGLPPAWAVDNTASGRAIPSVAVARCCSVPCTSSSSSCF